MCWRTRFSGLGHRSQNEFPHRWAAGLNDERETCTTAMALGANVPCACLACPKDLQNQGSQEKVVMRDIPELRSLAVGAAGFLLAVLTDAWPNIKHEFRVLQGIHRWRGAGERGRRLSHAHESR